MAGTKVRGNQIKDETITGTQVEDESLTGSDVEDGTIQKKDLDITTVGQSVVTEIEAGDNVTITETGADAGTGKVTINASNIDVTYIDGGDANSVYDSELTIDGGGA
jgi:hypothetical protein